MLQTVLENMAGLTAREVKKAVLALKDQAQLGTPTEADFIDMVSKGTLKTFPVTLVDIANSLHMFVPDLPVVKIKTVRRKPDMVEEEDIFSNISDYHRFVSVTLTVDVMFVNSIPFLITFSRRIRLLTV